VKRDWAAARAKITAEGRCRYCGTTKALEVAHVLPRSRLPGPEAMDDRNVIPLCAKDHRLQHAGRLELLPLLSLEEQAFIVSLVGIEEARRRTIRRAA
jgi:hypothetical protein